MYFGGGKGGGTASLDPGIDIGIAVEDVALVDEGER